MAFSVRNNGGRRGRSSGALAEINIVPLVDVVLVLLVIFMLTAHVMEFGLEVEVPKVRQSRDSTKELPVVSITKSGELYLNESPVNINELGAAVRKRYGKAQSVYLRADSRTVWDPIAHVISALGEAKLGVQVVTQPEDMADRPRK
ncbi:MAG: biopolymer transporter ExbD [Bryobacterales bacterium]|nr:biopolymer transporter ExbD [Bryobacterales bacterium]